jgi:G:T-mismatch repair DNA endonuclease (very short patch repair protein)
VPKKKTLDFVIDEFDKRGFTLVTSHYESSRWNVRYVCPNGHVRVSTLASFSTGSGCLECVGKVKKTLDVVISEFDSRGHILVTSDYKNNQQKLRYVCPEGHIRTIKYNGFQQGDGCSKCVGRNRGFDEVLFIFDKMGFTVVSYLYTGYSSKLRLVCKNGHICNLSVKDISNGHRCGDCSKNKRKDISEVRVEFEKRGYSILTDTYKNNSELILCRCANGHILRKSFHNLMGDHGCLLCAPSPISSISQKWLSVLFIENREHTIVVKDGIRYRVDGFSPAEKIVYEFLGDFYHGNPARFAPEDFNKKLKKSFGQLFEETIKKLESLADAGYRVVYVWEADFKKGKMISGTLEPKTNTKMVTR